MISSNMDSLMKGTPHPGAANRAPPGDDPNAAPMITPVGPGPGGGGGTPIKLHDLCQDVVNGGAGVGANPVSSPLDRDYYGCYCLKFIVKNGTYITEEKVQQDFGQFGDVVDVRGPGLFSGLRGNHVYVRFIDRSDAQEALRHLAAKYHQLTPASISDVLPDNYGLYTISFYNKTGIPSAEVRREFSKFGEVKNLTGSLDVKGGRVFVSYKEKISAVQALQAFFFRKDRYPNMKFALPRCEKDYFGCYCLKFYNKSGDVTEEKVLRDFGQFGEVVDVRGPGLFDVNGDDVYVRYKEKSSAEQALIELVGKYDSLCLAPPSDIQADKFGYFTITFVNDKCLSKSDVWYIFSKFGTVACVNGTFDCKKGRVFVSYKEKQGALNALETMLITKEYHLQVSKNSTVRKNDYNVIGGNGASSSGSASVASKDAGGECAAPDFGDFSSVQQQSLTGVGGCRNGEKQLQPPPSLTNSPMCPGNLPGSSVLEPGPSVLGTPHHRDLSRGRGVSGDGLVQNIIGPVNVPPPSVELAPSKVGGGLPIGHNGGGGGGGTTSKNGLVKFNRNVEKDIFGYYCLSFLNEDGDISEKKVRHDFGKFGEVVSVRGALGKQKGHVFVRFRRKEAAENCLNCLNSFPLSEMSELFGKYLFLSPATPRDIDCDMYGLYSISFLNLNMKTFREIRQEFSKFGEIVRLTSGGGGNTDELVSISYEKKVAAERALQSHFTNKEFPYLDIAKGSSLLLVNSSDSSDNEDNECDYTLHAHRQQQQQQQQQLTQRAQQQESSSTSSSDPFHDPSPVRNGFGGSDVVDELLKPFQSYFSIYRTGQYQSLHGGASSSSGDPGELPGPIQTAFMNGVPQGAQLQSSSAANRSPDKKYRIKSVKTPINATAGANGLMKHEKGSNIPRHPPPPPPPPHPAAFSVPPPMLLQQKREQRVEPGGSPHRAQSVPPPLLQAQPSQMTNNSSAITNAATSSTSSITSTPSSSIQASPEREVATAQAVTVTNQMIPLDLRKEASSIEQSPAVAPLGNDAAPCTSLPSLPERQFEVVKDDRRTTEVTSAEESTNTGTVKGDKVQQDLLGYFSLSFTNRSKDLTERKVRMDFGPEAVARVRGLTAAAATVAGSSNESVVTVSFFDEAAALAALGFPALLAKYSGLSPAHPVTICPDRDGAYSIEFINSGMSGIREITNEFSRHGEVVKVMAGGAKNAVKKVTVSYAERDAALAAVKTHSHSKDYESVDFSKECLMEMEGAKEWKCSVGKGAPTPSS